MFDHIENKEREAAEAREALNISAPKPCGALRRLVGHRIAQDRPWSEYPIGTKAHAIMGGHWVRVEHGWRWFNGSTFPTPGGDAVGSCIELPNNKPSCKECA